VSGETTVNGSKKPLRILIDAGSSSYIILKKFIYKSVSVKNLRTITEWTTLWGGGGVLHKETRYSQI
jgi:predicted aspartyl protease